MADCRPFNLVDLNRGTVSFSSYDPNCIKNHCNFASRVSEKESQRLAGRLKVMGSDTVIP
jgi:hypothetical protein